MLSTSSEPSFFSASTFSGLDVQEITSAPSSLQRITQPVPTPPEAPRMTTLSPFLMVLWVTIMRCAVP